MAAIFGITWAVRCGTSEMKSYELGCLMRIGVGGGKGFSHRLKGYGSQGEKNTVAIVSMGAEIVRLSTRGRNKAHSGQ